MVWFLVPVLGAAAAAGTIYGLHSTANATSIYVAHALYGGDAMQNRDTPEPDQIVHKNRHA